MAEFVSAAKTVDVPAGRGKTVHLGEKRIALFNIDGAFYAIDDTCLHRGGPLSEGELENCVVTCPWHGWKFDVRTGEMTMNAAARVKIFSKCEKVSAILSLQLRIVRFRPRYMTVTFSTTAARC